MYKWSLASAMLFSLSLLFTACKPAVRAPVAELFAVTDGQLTLGAVPIEKDDGAQAYRLLVCKKSMTYPKWMLEDTSRCRIALLTESGQEVAFLSDHMQRGFAAKYSGYAKQAALVIPTIVGVAVVGNWLIRKPFMEGTVETVTDAAGIVREKTGFVKEFWDTTKNKISRLIPDAFKNRVLGPAGINYHRGRYSAAVLAHETALKVRKPKKVVEALQISRAEEGKILEAGENLRSAEKRKELLTNLQKLDETERSEQIASMQKEAERLRGTFDNPIQWIWNHRNKLQGRIPAVFSSSDLSLQKEYLDGLSNYNDLDMLRGILDKSNKGSSFDFLDNELKSVDEAIIKARDAYRAAKDAKNYALGGVKLSALKTGAVGGAAAGAVMLATIDTSIWGHGERQVSKYWSQIFHEKDSFGNAASVGDLRGILNTLADTFGFVVNEQALALGK